MVRRPKTVSHLLRAPAWPGRIYKPLIIGKSAKPRCFKKLPRYHFCPWQTPTTPRPGWHRTCSKKTGRRRSTIRWGDKHRKIFLLVGQCPELSGRRTEQYRYEIIPAETPHLNSSLRIRAFSSSRQTWKVTQNGNREKSCRNWKTVRVRQAHRPSEVWMYCKTCSLWERRGWRFHQRRYWSVSGWLASVKFLVSFTPLLFYFLFYYQLRLLNDLQIFLCVCVCVCVF